MTQPSPEQIEEARTLRKRAEDWPGCMLTPTQINRFEDEIARALAARDTRIASLDLRIADQDEIIADYRRRESQQKKRINRAYNFVREGNYESALDELVEF